MRIGVALTKTGEASQCYYYPRSLVPLNGFLTRIQKYSKRKQCLYIFCLGSCVQQHDGADPGRGLKDSDQDAGTKLLE